MNPRFNIPSNVVFGAGASGDLVPQLQLLGISRVLLVTDAFMVTSGLAGRIRSELAAAKITAEVFAEVQPDPTEPNVLRGLASYRSSGSEAVVALGGGSSIDCGKAISVLTANPLPLNQYVGRDKLSRAGAPLIAIPTTAGTGSEVTKVAVITDTGRGVKMMMLDPRLLPTIALVDYELTLSMPKPLTAAVGVDTLTHGIEAYVSRLANPMTDPLALSCIRLVAEHLERAWCDPSDRVAREGMMLAATQGGMAFANSSVCLVHGMSRPIGALFHVPHGISNAMLLPEVTRFSLTGAIGRYAAVARAMDWARNEMSDAEAAHALVKGLERLNRALEIPRLRDYPKMDRARFEEALDKMAADALASGSPQNNPVAPSADQIMELYRIAW